MEFTGLGLPQEPNYQPSRLTLRDFFLTHFIKIVIIIITIVLLVILVFTLTYLLLKQHSQSEEQRLPSNYSWKEFDCSSYSSDLDIIKSLPTNIKILNETDIRHRNFPNSASINDKKQVVMLYLNNTNESLQVYCLLNLYDLTVDGDILLRVPPEIGNLTHLKELVLTNIAGEKVPSTMGRLKMLRNLHLVGDDLQELPEELAALTRLTSLEIDANLQTMPSFISMLPIQRLLFSTYSRFSVIPSGFFKNLKPHLRSLSIGVSHPSALEQLCESTNLKALILYADALLEFPMSLTHVSSLHSLFLRGTLNQITSLSQNFSSLPIWNLELGGNAFNEIPPVLANCSKLSALNLTQNRITNISAILTNTSKLTFLSLSRNDIQRIPLEITLLSKTLNYLELAYNKLITVPAEELVNMKKLTVLGIRNNPIPSDELARLKRIFSTKPSLKVYY